MKKHKGWSNFFRHKFAMSQKTLIAAAAAAGLAVSVGLAYYLRRGSKESLVVNSYEERSLPASWLDVFDTCLIQC